MPIIMLAFVNIIMLILAKYAEIMHSYASTLFFEFGKNTSITMQQTCKWQIHFPYLHPGKLRVHH